MENRVTKRVAEAQAKTAAYIGEFVCNFDNVVNDLVEAFNSKEPNYQYQDGNATVYDKWTISVTCGLDGKKKYIGLNIFMTVTPDEAKRLGVYSKANSNTFKEYEVPQGQPSVFAYLQGNRYFDSSELGFLNIKKKIDKNKVVKIFEDAVQSAQFTS
jgi:hypothetical protein